MANDLLASAPTQAAIMECITRFYCGSAKDLVPTGPKEWAVANPATGQQLPGVRVVQAKGRFRFEMR